MLPCHSEIDHDPILRVACEILEAHKAGNDFLRPVVCVPGISETKLRCGFPQPRCEAGLDFIEPNWVRARSLVTSEPPWLVLATCRGIDAPPGPTQGLCRIQPKTIGAGIALSTLVVSHIGWAAKLTPTN